MKLNFLIAALVIFDAARGLADSVSVELTAGKPVEVVIDSLMDDRDFAEPRGHREHGASSRVFQRRMTLTNTGSTPLVGPLLVINGEDWSSPESLRQTLQLNGPAGEWMPRLFAFWSDQVSHADADVEGGKEPLALLNFWSYALCGDTTAALTRLATAFGVPARKIPLNGHVAAEYFFDDAWHILDADQKVCYLRLDNRTLASAADLRADPFLARRTKVLGRHAPLDPAAMAFNTSLHEFLAPQESKPVKSKTPPAPVRSETLFPGEKLIFHSDRPPEQPLSRTNLNTWGSVRADALRLMEFALQPGARGATENGAIIFASGFPILHAINRATGETIKTPAGQATFEITIPVRTADDAISIFCQRSQISLPRLHRDRNTFTLAAKGPGTASLEIEWERPAAGLVVPALAAKLLEPTPIFAVETAPTADRIWWQVSAFVDFRFIAPNFDNVTPAAKRISFHPLTATFLNPDQEYFFRARARHDGVWSTWSAPLIFRAEKPPRPAPITATIIAGSRLRLTWPDAGEQCEYLLFGSNRRDFVPDVFETDEIVAMREQVVTDKRPNKNLVATTARPELEIEPAFRFYRLLARRTGVLSVPSDLIVTPPSLAAKLPPALVLQNRWRRVPDPKKPGAETDEYLASEMPLR